MSTGVITGVVRGTTGAALGGTCITATGPAGSSTVMSRPGGRYLIDRLRPGEYTLRIHACESASVLQGNAITSFSLRGLPPVVSVLPGQVRRLAPATVWGTGWDGLANGHSPAQPAVESSKAGSISGRVTGHGHLLAHICALAIQPFGGWHGPEPTATTSKTGRYRIRGLRPGRYLVLFRTGERSCPSDANWLPQWYPNVDSSYPPGKAAEVRVRAGKNTGHIDGRLKLGGEIAGIVRTRTGKPIRGICVDFYSPFLVNFGYLANVASVSGKTGHYALRGLFPGSYQVEFMIGCGTRHNYAAQWWRHKSSPADANSIKIAARRIVTGVNATLMTGAAIAGTVRAKTTAAKPLAAVCVSASDNQGRYAESKTARNGTYRLEGLDSGTYQVSFDPTCSGFVSANYLPAQRSVTITSGHARSGFDAYLRPAAGISGVVRDSAGKPVDSVCVTIGDQNSDYAFTNAHGFYSITGVVPGKYPVYFETDCGSRGSLASQWYDNQPDSDSADPVTFTGGKIDRNVDVTLHPGGTLAGILTSTTGQPVKSDCIGLVAEHNLFGLSNFSDTASTSRDGHYVLQNITPGEYQVSFDCEDGQYANQWFNHQPDSTTASYLAVNAGVTTTLNQKLSPAGRIAGTVTNKAGHPIANVCISVANASNGQIITPVNGGAMTYRGHYVVGQLTPGRYLVQFVDCGSGVFGSQWYHKKYSVSSAARVTVRAGRTTSGINAVLTIGGTISGTVRGPSGKPANGTCVQAYDNASQSFGSTWTSKAGYYKLEGLSNGRYSVSFSECDPQAPNLGSVTLPRLVRVAAPHHVIGVNIKLAAGGSIAGTMTGHSSPSGPQNQACVTAAPTNRNGSYPLVFTDASGHYLMSGLAAGTYKVDLGDPICDFYDFGVPNLTSQWYDDQPGQPTATLVTVSAGHITRGISATLQPFGGIEGKVTNRAHADVAGECVKAVPFQATVDLLSGLAPAPDVAITTPAGRYKLLDLPPGQYKIEFSKGCGDTAFATQWWDSATSARAAKVITVGNVTIGGIDATLRR
jgi:protocatechuate 3,4-dioxygenase beta subunit